MKSFKVRIWEPRVKTPARTTKDGKKKPATYQVRWSVKGEPFSTTLPNKQLATSYHAKLLTAVRDGEGFDTEIGLPDSMRENPQASTVLELMTQYVDSKWKRLAAKSRETTIYALAAAGAALVADLSGAPDTAALRRALHRWYLEPARRTPEAPAPPSEVAKALAWLEKASLPVPALNEPKIAHRLLDALATTMDGSTASADYIKRRRGVIVNFTRYAIVCGELDEDPFKRIQWTAPKTAKQIDGRRVPNPKQVSDLLVGVSYVGTWKRARGRRLVAFFGCLYYAMMRPEEAIGLHEDDCDLPKTGWGLLTLHKAKPYAGRRWTDSGELHDDKGLKQRATDDVRPVPIPPVLVAMLRSHIDTFGVGNNGRIFHTEHGNPLTPFAYQQVWKLAREIALPPQRAKSSLAAVPYDLRHAGISLGLRATRDPALIAERAGQSVQILMTRYAWCLDDKDAPANGAIEDALGET